MSKQTNDGGPAFPISEWHLKSANGRVTHPDWRGMTLRDYFAAKAMEALVQAIVGHSGSYGDLFPNEIAGLAYQQADAMLRAREQGEPK